MQILDHRFNIYVGHLPAGGPIVSQNQEVIYIPKAVVLCARKPRQPRSEKNVVRGGIRTPDFCT